ncbi:hypothetical protein K490DRAFT_65126 [Saccharata proteae CBS 121410]|uniref:Zn(2)-C6 fungal-type domain-containing protein n=1 Tax=Saccharata proteae CBS 121410 TaxID=1314787 RepID=A0A9P4HYD6_9PEZI|nr:hypothetical protein K490DRAFT_65126 [Saccharata proteae CBS 121410]
MATDATTTMAASPPHSATAQAPSSASPRQSSAQPGQSHTRTYQACIPCRRRKVRCDLGPVDNPHDPPCVRCRRETKDCFFSATRRKRKPVDAGEGIEDDGPSDYEVRNGRKRLRAEDSLTPQRQPSISMSMSQYNADEPQRPVTPGGSIGRYQPLRRPAGHHGSSHEDEQKVNNDTAAILQSHEVYSGHDALNLLFEAAGRTGDMDHHRTASTSSVPRPPTASIPTPGSQPSLTSPGANAGRPYPSPITRTIQEPAIDPAIAQGYPEEEQDNEAEYQEALRAWSRFRFVRAGWFTAKEGVAYMDYFYKYLSPLTPIVVPNFEHYSTHVTLLTEEPMLTITLLTVSSRYMSLTGPGASSRPYAIHEKLWHYLQGMIDRTIWGQEQFGGGFCGAGAQQGSDINPLSRTGLRTLGTVESLMLLTEWHPRALHFPPGDDDDELMTPEDITTTQAAYSAAHPTIQRERYRGVGGQRIDSWLEPCWRSDRMCWMLLGNALALAYEIGVFDEKSETEFQAENRSLPPTKVEAYFRRKNHLRELLLIYITQTSGRVGITSMLPRSQRDVSFLKTPDERLQERFANLKKAGRVFRGDSGISAPSPGTQKLIDSQEMVLYFWMEIAAIMERGNQEMFANRRATRDLITTGEYKQLLHKFQPLLRDYREHLDKWRHIIPKLMCDILSIEFEYSRVYLNSLALQAVVVRCTHHNTAMQAQSPAPNGAPQEMVSAPFTKNGAIPAASLIKWYGDDHFYIKEVVDGCRNVLTIVIKGLEPGGYLKHAPVRTFFRIISVAIILLKTFVLGATEDEVAISIGLMEEAVSALRSCIVDDVHVGNRFADLLMTLIVTIKARFVRMINSASGKASLQASRAGSRSPVTQSAGPVGGVNDSNNKLRQQAPMMPPPQPGQNYGANQWGYGNGMGMSQSPSLANDPNSRSNSTPNANHPLWGISTETYDPGTNNISIMPPPTFGSPYQTNHHLPDAANQFGGVGDAGGGYGGGYGMNGQDWLALPLDPLLASYGADVSNTTYGPDVGGYDLLDVLLNGVDGGPGGV